MCRLSSSRRKRAFFHEWKEATWRNLYHGVNYQLRNNETLEKIAGNESRDARDRSSDIPLFRSRHT